LQHEWSDRLMATVLALWVVLFLFAVLREALRTPGSAL